MKIETRITEMISVERIKPSSPTPHHLRIYNISLLDQLMPCAYVTLVLYFFGDGDDNGDDRIQHLKESLSQTLATFYPFAGVIRDALSADCNDQGLPFSVAKVNAQMRDFLQNPNVELINKLFPGEYGECGRDKLPGPGDSTMLIQLNCFDCGGIAISIVFCHSIADLASISTFVRCWAANARGIGFSQVPLSICAAQSSFPQKPSLPDKLVPFNTFIKYMTAERAKFVTKRYVFDASVLSILKAQLVSSSTGATPSRVDVVTALIWKCFMEALAEENEPKPYLMAHSVNMRRRAAPPFPEDSFGNYVWTPVAVCSNPQEKKLRELVWEVKKGVAKIDGEFVRRLGSDDLFEFLEGFRKEMPQQAKMLGITSWSNMGLNEVDFGWGKPVWLSGSVADNSESETVGNGNFVTLIDTRGGGIEACVVFDQKYIAKFEKNDHIRNYARVNPSVI